ncbi:MAG: HAD-IC family P-type ATPase [Candidatus Lokiarchaeota archaeon]|nr:HAD-IC family P-type ATPase [Candidatus Lokiarchaeota archaeon]
MIQRSIESQIYHSMDEESMLKKLKSSYEGISDVEAEERLRIYGPNELTVKKKRTKLQLFLSQFTNGITYILIAAALISLIVGKIVNVAVIFAVIILNGVIGFVQEAKADAALSALQTMATPEADVIRNCQSGTECIELRIKSKNVVIGDLILLEAGDKVPADARLIEVVNLEVDESMLTGESVPVRKKTGKVSESAPLADRKNLVYSGTLVTGGRGRAIVFATGMETEMGKISSLIDEAEDIQSPLQTRIDDLTKKLGLLAVITSMATFFIGILRGFDIIEMLLFGIATLVSSIPAGLPAAITITLAVGVQKMVKRHAIIRKLSAIDSLGGVTTITTDKTGTLTTNQMTARRAYINNTIYEITGIGYIPEGIFRKISGTNEDGGGLSEVKDGEPLYRLIKTAILCNDSHLVENKVEQDASKWEITGDPTEGALLVAGAKLHLQKEDLRRSHPRVDEIPFDPKYRFMITFNLLDADNNDRQVELHLKGAPESVINLCKTVLMKGGLETLSEETAKQILDISSEFASNGLRVLGFATATFKIGNIDGLKKEILDFAERGANRNVKELTFLGLVGMIDPPREEVKQAITLTRTAGIQVIMATGDHKLTAKAIGEEIGIVKPESEIIEGTELENMTDEMLDQKIGAVAAFVRVSPTHKFRVVNSLRRKQNIVAMTGDGANDAPALKAADIGIAMGITGTDITKETAKMVLTDDNFASIVNAIEEGRVVADNIKKGLKFLLTTNIGEVLTILLSIIILTDSSPLFTALAILWVNLVTDGGLTVAIAREPKESDVMKRPPNAINEKILNKSILFEILFTAVVMAGGVLLISQLHGGSAPITEKQTLAFNALAFYQIINAVNCRSRSQSIFQLGFWSNRSIAIGLLISISLQIIAVQVPFMNVILGTTPLGWIDWIIIIAGALSLLIADELRKFYVRKKASNLT